MSWKRTPIDLGGDTVVPLATVKAFARVFTPDEDGLFRDLFIPAAIKKVSIDTRWQIDPVTLTITAPAGTRTLCLPEGPFIAIAEAVSIDLDDNETEIEGVEVDDDFRATITIPAIAQPIKSIRVSAQVGTNPAPAEIALLVCTLAAHFSEHREAVTADGVCKEVPLAYRDLVASLDPGYDCIRVAGGRDQ